MPLAHTLPHTHTHHTHLHTHIRTQCSCGKCKKRKMKQKRNHIKWSPCGASFPSSTSSPRLLLLLLFIHICCLLLHLVLALCSISLSLSSYSVIIARHLCNSVRQVSFFLYLSLARSVQLLPFFWVIRIHCQHIWKLNFIIKWQKTNWLFKQEYFWKRFL